MNLHAIASNAIGAVNPSVPATIKVNSGSTTNPDGTRVPAFETPIFGTAQVQALTFGDLRQIDGLNLTGERRSIYFNGQFNGVSRPRQMGGDLIILTDGPNAGTWLTVYVMEQWPDWCKIICTLQSVTP